MPSWQSNKDQVKANIAQGGWHVAYGRELTETDAAQGAVAAGVSIFTAEPGPVLAWLDELVTESIDQMEASVVATFTPVARQHAIQFAQGVIRSLLQGHNVGEQFTNVFHFKFKAGVAQFIGQNFIWVPNVTPAGIIDGIETGDTGGHWEFVSPNQISYCPYVGLCFDPTVGGGVPSSRVMWSGGSSVFRLDGSQWNEYQNGVVAHRFVQMGQDQNFIYLYDGSRNLHLSLGSGKGYWRQGNTGNWNYWTPGSWGQVG